MDASSSTKPYLLRALHEWCTDNGFTPYLAVQVDARVRVPREHVKNGEIVLNVAHSATSGLHMGNDAIVFKARFGGVPRDVMVPISHVTAIYARETGQGMAFPAPEAAVDDEADSAPADEQARPPRLHSVPADAETGATPGDSGTPPDDTPPDAPPRPPAGSHLKRVK